MEKNHQKYWNCNNEFDSDFLGVSFTASRFIDANLISVWNILYNKRHIRFFSEQQLRFISSNCERERKPIGFEQMYHPADYRRDLSMMHVKYKQMRNCGFYSSGCFARVVFAYLTIGVVVVFLSFSAIAGSIDTTDQYSWGENIGWLVWGTTEGNVTIPDSATDGELTGYVWGENVGWISLNCNNTSSCGTVDYSVDRSEGSISGYAWGENVGWISFNCNNTSSCETVDYSVAIATSSGEFSGYAWGENIGWIVMNCLTTSSCGAVDYKVVASTPTPTPTPTPTSTPTPSVGSAGVVPLPSVVAISSSPSPTVSDEVSPVSDIAVVLSVSPPPPVSGPAEPSKPASMASPVGPPDVGNMPSGVPGFTGFVDYIGQKLDSTAGVVGRIVDEPIKSGAGAMTLIALIPLFLVIIEIIRSKSVGAATSEFLQAFGLKKRPRVWGIVYDAKTKHSVSFARVQVFDETNRMLETRFTDRDGRYGFLLSSSGTQGQVRKVRVVVTKKGFLFPSKMVSSGVDYIVYEHLYFGDVIEITGESSLTYDIPIDPIAMPIGVKRSRSLFAMVMSKSWQAVLNLGFYAGLILVPYNIVISPTTVNFVIGALFFGANAFRIFKIERPYGRIRDIISGKTVPFSLVTLHDQSGKRLSFSVSDEYGRYFLSTEGEKDYQMRVYTPANIIPQRTITEDIARESSEVRRGWITRKLKI